MLHISTSLKKTPNFCKSPLLNSISVIQSSGSLVTPSNSIFENLLHSIVLDNPSIRWNLLCNLSNSWKSLPLCTPLVTNASTIWKHTMLSCSKARSFYVLLLSCLSIVSFLVFYSEFSTRFFTVLLRMISYPNHPDIANNFLDHIRNLSLSPLKGIILMFLSSILLDLTWLWSLFYPPRITLRSMLEDQLTLYSTKFLLKIGFTL